MKNQIRNGLVVSLSILTLTACGGSGGETPNTGETPNIGATLNITDRIASVRVAGTYNNNDTPRIDFDDAYNYNLAETQDTVSLRSDDNDDLILTVNGVDHVFTSRLIFTNIFSGSGNISLITPYNPYSVLAGTHETAQGMYIRYTTDTNDYQTEETNFNLNHTIGYATIGTQTPVSVVGTQTATATYVGEVRVDFAQVNVANGTQIASSTYSGELVMPVDFDNMTLGGTITFGDEGTATFATAPIVGNGFSGTFTLDQGARDYVGVTDNPTGNYAGNFFGSNAEDLAGVMSLRGTSSRGAVIGIGGFRGDRR